MPWSTPSARSRQRRNNRRRPDASSRRRPAIGLSRPEAGVRPRRSYCASQGSARYLGVFGVAFAIASTRPTSEWRILRCAMPPNAVNSLRVLRSGMSLTGAGRVFSPGDVTALASNRRRSGYRISWRSEEAARRRPGSCLSHISVSAGTRRRAGDRGRFATCPRSVDERVWILRSGCPRNSAADLFLFISDCTTFGR